MSALQQRIEQAEKQLAGNVIFTDIDFIQGWFVLDQHRNVALMTKAHTRDAAIRRAVYKSYLEGKQAEMWAIMERNGWTCEYLIIKCKSVDDGKGA
jgi:hypothetical protein